MLFFGELLHVVTKDF